MSEYIERSMAIAAITGWETDPTDEELEWTLNNVPAADVVEVKHGRWEHLDFVSPSYKCSVCGGLAPWDGCGDYPSERTNYCPNCGAKMDGE